MSDNFYRLKVAGRILDALYSSSNEAVAQGMLIFGTAGAEVCVLGPGGDVVWAAAASHRHAPLRSGSFIGPGAEAVGESR